MERVGRELVHTETKGLGGEEEGRKDGEGGEGTSTH